MAGSAFLSALGTEESLNQASNAYANNEGADLPASWAAHAGLFSLCSSLLLRWWGLLSLAIQQDSLVRKLCQPAFLSLGKISNTSLEERFILLKLSRGFYLWWLGLRKKLSRRRTLERKTAQPILVTKQRGRKELGTKVYLLSDPPGSPPNSKLTYWTHWSMNSLIRVVTPWSNHLPISEYEALEGILNQNRNTTKFSAILFYRAPPPLDF